MDRPGVRQVPEGSGERGKMEKTGCKIICGAPTTLAVKGLMMMMTNQNVAKAAWCGMGPIAQAADSDNVAKAVWCGIGPVALTAVWQCCKSSLVWDGPVARATVSDNVATAAWC